MSTSSENFIENFRTTIMQSHHLHCSVSPKDSPSAKVKFISPEKWRHQMLKALKEIARLPYANPDLIHDLKYIIQNISQDRFVQAVLSVEPLKPKFQKQANHKFLGGEGAAQHSSAAQSVLCQKDGKIKKKTRLQKNSSIIQRGSIVLMKKQSSIQKQHTKPLSSQKVGNPNSTVDSETITKPLKKKESYQNTSDLKEYLEVIIQEEALKKDFEKKYHPFRKIIDNFAFILENKFKSLIDQQLQLEKADAGHKNHLPEPTNLESIQQLICLDVLILKNLFVQISEPYKNIFQSEDPEETELFRKKLEEFMENYIHFHPKITQASRKVMRYYARKNRVVLEVQKNIEDFILIEKFDIPQDFKIEGLYVQAMSALMNFAESHTPEESLQGLKQFRASIGRDVDEYYVNESLTESVKEREINAEIQIEIVKFVMCKLKGWIPEIYAQLKYLEVVYGDEQMAYKYDDASYIYAQLITVFDLLEMEADESYELQKA